MMVTKKQTASQRYWEKRRELEDKNRYKLENKTIEALYNQFRDAMKAIEKELLAHAEFYNMTYEEMVADYSLRDQRAYRKAIDERYQELMSSDEAYQEFIDEFFPEYDYAKVNRLLNLRAQMFQELAKKGIDANKLLEEDLKNLIGGTYSSNKQLFNILYQNDSPLILNNKEMEAILNYPWSGKSFSKSLWGNVAQMEKILTEELINAKKMGLGADATIKAMRQRFDRASKHNIERLVRTEYTHFAEEAIHQGYKDTNIEEYENLSSEDERVCSICGAEHGKRHKVKEAISGVNRSPFHSRCRCTDIPVLPELGPDIDKLYDEMFGTLLDDFAKDYKVVRKAHSFRGGDG